MCFALYGVYQFVLYGVYQFEKLCILSLLTSFLSILCNLSKPVKRTNKDIVLLTPEAPRMNSKYTEKENRVNGERQIHFRPSIIWSNVPT